MFGEPLTTVGIDGIGTRIIIETITYGNLKNILLRIVCLGINIADSLWPAPYMFKWGTCVHLLRIHFGILIRQGLFNGLGNGAQLIASFFLFICSVQLFLYCLKASPNVFFLGIVACLWSAPLFKMRSSASLSNLSGTSIVQQPSFVLQLHLFKEIICSTSLLITQLLQLLIINFLFQLSGC